MATALEVASSDGHFKDQILDRLADSANVAQFVSFSPNLSIRFARLHGGRKPDSFGSVDAAVGELLAQAVEGRVNIRSFDPRQPKAHDFVYGIEDTASALAEVRRLASAGLFTIVNETIDIHDGGVSGVAYAGVLEFAPDDTPRSVDKPGTAALPHDLGLRVLETVYGFRPALHARDDLRVEFSIHPRRHGVRHGHTIVWEEEVTDAFALKADIGWPNRFSRMLGDKTYGLLVADALGLRVPRTVVVSRRVAPFAFGVPTESGEHWLRTAPLEQLPGLFTTERGWVDPFELLAREDPTGDKIAAVLAQEGVDPMYSGAAVSARPRALIEGVIGPGANFMQGEQAPEPLPSGVVEDVERVLHQAAGVFGADVRIEWVHDGDGVWIVQLHRGASPTTELTIHPGTPTVEHEFPVERGLEELRELVGQLQNTGEGVVLVGAVGVTSHFGDVLRRAQIPARIKHPAEPVPLQLFST